MIKTEFCIAKRPAHYHGSEPPRAGLSELLLPQRDGLAPLRTDGDLLPQTRHLFTVEDRPIKIYNCSPVSTLECFPHMSFEEAIRL